MLAEMTEERADEILSRYNEDEAEAIEDVLSRLKTDEEMTEVAEALMYTWRTYADEPGFNQPPGYLVQLVEDIIGEEVWPKEER